MRADINFALRQIRRRPVVAASIILTLGLSIGGAGAIFSVIRSVLLEPLAIADPNRVVLVRRHVEGGAYEALPLGQYWSIARLSEQFIASAAFFTTSASLTASQSAPTDASISLVTTDYFRVLGIPALLGRWFDRSDSADGTWNQQAVISYRLWQDRFAGARNIIGKRLTLNDQSVTVLGVMPRSFTGSTLSSVPDLWIPASVAPSLGLTLIVDGSALDQRTPVYHVIGRLRPTSTAAIAEKELETLATQTADGAPKVALGRSLAAASQSFRLTPVGQAAIAGDNHTRIVQILVSIAALVGITVLLAAVNIASLLMAVGNQRAPEYAVRIALGADAKRLFRQVGSECALLACAGALVAAVTCALVLKLVSQFTLPGGLALDRLDLHISVATMELIILGNIGTMTPFAMLAARNAVNVPTIGGLRATMPGVGMTRTLALTTQVTICLMLLVGTALFIRSVTAGLATDFGFDPSGVVVLSAKAPFAGKHMDIIQPYVELGAALRQIPGMQVAYGSHVPLEGTWKQRTVAGALGVPRDPRAAPVMMGVESVSDDYFRTLRIPMKAGRGFNEGDTRTAPRVIVLNETAALRLFPGRSALGQTVTAGPIFDYAVVGIVRDTKYLTLQDSAVAFGYVSMMQGDLMGRIRFVVASDSPRQTLAILRTEASRYAGSLKSMRLDLESDRLAESLAPQRVGVRLLSSLALIALCVAAVGMYGTVSYIVSRRTAEIGVRRALGAASSHIARLVIQQCAVAIGLGISAGVVGSLLLGNLIAHFLFRVSARDWFSFAGAVAVMILVGGAAILLPARRALHIDAASAIRSAT